MTQAVQSDPTNKNRAPKEGNTTDIAQIKKKSLYQESEGKPSHKLGL